MPRGRQPEGEIALSNAERQARWRARRREVPPAAPVPQPPPPARQRGRAKRWNDAVGVLLTVQAECVAWFDKMPDSLRDTAMAEALQEMIDLDLDAIAAVQPPRGYGRD
jgi:hypothetical protein